MFKISSFDAGLHLRFFPYLIASRKTLSFRSPPIKTVTAKKIFIKSFGCQMNEYDSNRIVDLMTDSSGYIKTNSAEDADLVILNTCSIRDKAQQKVYSELGRIRTLKEQRPGMKIAVGGCVASQEGSKIIDALPTWTSSSAPDASPPARHAR